MTHLPLLSLSVAFCLLSACAQPANDGTDGETNGADAGTDPDGGGGTGDECKPLQDDVTAAIRGLPRDCVSDDDCQIIDRGGQCECEGVFSASADASELISALSALDDAECRHPFACVGTSDCEYDVLTPDGEILAQCDGGSCKPVQVMTCDDYVAKSEGGIIPPQACETDTDCYLRDDLNPCRCAEAVSKDFPALTASAVADLMAIDTPRCSPVCDGCIIPNAAVCKDVDGTGDKVCVAE